MVEDGERVVLEDDEKLWWKMVNGYGGRHLGRA